MKILSSCSCSLYRRHEARQILAAGPKTEERALAFILAAMVCATVHPEQGFTILDESAIAANDTPALKSLELTGEEVKIEDQGFTNFFLMPPPLKVDLTKGFQALAKVDLERAVAAAQSFNAKEIKARAIVAVASGLLRA